MPKPLIINDSRASAAVQPPSKSPKTGNVEKSRPGPKTGLVAPAIIRGATPPPGGTIGALNELSATKDYAADPLLPSGTNTQRVISERMSKLTDKEVAKKMAILFPTVDCGEVACDCFVIVQELLVPKTMGGGAILRSDTSRDLDQAVTTYGKIASIGPIAFTWEMTGEPFQGGAPFKVGDIVRIPKYAGQEFLIDDIHFNYFKDRDIKGVIADHRKIVAIHF